MTHVQSSLSLSTKASLGSPGESLAPHLTNLYETFEVPFAIVTTDPAEELEEFRLPFDLPPAAMDAVHMAEFTGEPQLEQLNDSSWVFAIPIVASTGAPSAVAVARLNVAPAGARSPSRLADLLARAGESARHIILRWARTVAEQMNDESPAQSNAAEDPDSPHALAVAILQRLLASAHHPLPQQLSSHLPLLAARLGFEGMAWVPSSLREQPVIVGRVPVKPQQLRRIVGQATRLQPVTDRCWILAGVPALERLGIQNLIATATDGSRPLGWLVGINCDSLIGREFEVVGPIKAVSAAVTAVVRMDRMHANYQGTVLGFLRAMTAAIDAKDPYTRGHSERVAQMSYRIARAAGLDHVRCSQIRVAGLLHDIGKIGVSDSVLKKAGPLTEEEWEHIKSHVEIGVTILRHVPSLKHLIPGVRAHHERLDGKGYPDGLAGNQIPLEGRIIAIADAFDAMCSDRSYRKRRSPEEVRKVFEEGAGTQWDPELVRVAFSIWNELVQVREGDSGDSLARAIEEAIVDRARQNMDVSVRTESPPTVWEI